MATVFYNFDRLTITPGKTKTQSIVATQTTPFINIEYNKVPYFISSVYFCLHTGDNNPYFIIKTTADPQASAKCIYFAIPLTTSTDSTYVNTDIDKLFAAESAVTINLSGCIKDGDSAKIYTASNGWSTVVLDTPYVVKTAFTSATVMNTTGIENLTLSGSNPLQATITKQIFDWNMECTLVGEDEAGGQVNVVPRRIDTMDTMALLVILMLVVSSFYLAVPIIYKYYIIPIAKTRMNMPLASIDIYWSSISILAIIAFAIFGLKTKQTAYYFYAFTIGIILVISKKWVHENIGNVYSENKAEINVDFTANQKFGTGPHGIDSDYFSVFTTQSGGMNLKAIISTFFTMIIFLVTFLYSNLEEISNSKFSSSIISFIGLAIFTTSMFMDKIRWNILFFGIFIALATTMPMIFLNVMDLITRVITA
jgi:hypothetical protein